MLFGLVFLLPYCICICICICILICICISFLQVIVQLWKGGRLCQDSLAADLASAAASAESRFVFAFVFCIFAFCIFIFCILYFVFLNFVFLQPQREPRCQPRGQPCIQPEPLGLPSSPPSPHLQQLEPFRGRTLLLPAASPSPRKRPFHHPACPLREAEALEQAEEALQHDVATNIGLTLQRPSS